MRRLNVLNFVGAVFGEEPTEIPNHVWRDWQRDKIKQYGEPWPIVRRVIAEFRALGIHLRDVSPGIRAFRD